MSRYVSNDTRAENMKREDKNAQQSEKGVAKRRKDEAVAAKEAAKKGKELKDAAAEKIEKANNIVKGKKANEERSKAKRAADLQARKDAANRDDAVA